MSLAIDPFQYTLRQTVSCCGVGLHSGRTVNLAIKPAPVNSGIRFYRSDLPGDVFLNAHMDKVVGTQLATTLGNEQFRVSTTEHLLAAIQGFGIDNARIELDSDEVPIMDGSAEPFYKLLKTTGKSRQEALKTALRITRTVSYTEGDKHLSIEPYDGFKVTGEICFDDTLINKQKYTFDLLGGGFEEEIARARTFGYVEQVEELWANGLALGGSLANVIAIHWNRKSVLNEDGLRYDDEFIRHKVLDLVGDLALLGCPILGHVKAYKGGHAQHLGLMKAIAASPESWEVVEIKRNGAYAAIGEMAHKTRRAGQSILPFFTAPNIPSLSAA
ncbi:UDP-3-O-acyl-N-acetylglucosamine deacetylase [Desulforhopalus singaporensis]|uniref:UDP-3-O-acyl-N-acetylglucosamine deacetylase n=1 Tax=Desulforhopalus singaporensis TaxID=91360 RepID=A0A1H0PIK0_9BACT|nr:UDP-3-O-acyl-N-acetylglucosamine deacetylase [Desulforhopalus singaporensis]SDP04814.1 UDP-3-O-[3-hydroxymyristoyl] N-acetylglucosamine deacetylase [Desulforhopalus singaporensis]